MNKQEFLDRFNAIGQMEDAAQMRTALAEMRDDVTAVFDSNEELTTQNQQFATDNESLRSANMRLFLQVGEQRKQDEPTPEPPKPEKMSFDSLFDDKGNII